MTNEVFEDLVNLYLDKEISASQLRILKEELSRDTAKHRIFEDYCRMHQASHFAILSENPIIPKFTTQIGNEAVQGIWGQSKGSWAVAMALIVLIAFMGVYWMGPFAGNNFSHRNQRPTLATPESFYAANEVSLEQPSLDLASYSNPESDSAATSWSYQQELRHIGSNGEYKDDNRSSSYLTVEELRRKRRIDGTQNSFDSQLVNYEFKR